MASLVVCDASAPPFGSSKPIECIAPLAGYFSTSLVSTTVAYTGALDHLRRDWPARQLREPGAICSGDASPVSSAAMTRMEPSVFTAVEANPIRAGQAVAQAEELA